MWKKTSRVNMKRIFKCNMGYNTLHNMGEIILIPCNKFNNVNNMKKNVLILTTWNNNNIANMNAFTMIVIDLSHTYKVQTPCVL